MSLCNIIFENPQRVFYAGQNVCGSIELPVGETKNIQYLSVKIDGSASCKFYITEGNNNTTTYYAKENYLNGVVYLVGSYHGPPVELKAGYHSYKFSFFLPESLPTSFEGKYGKIRYSCTVTLDRPWALKSIQKLAFTVIKQLDLNKESPTIRLPSKKELSKKYSLTFSKYRDIYMSLELSASGFVAGQRVDVIVDVNNNCDIEVDEIKLSLKKCIMYRATKPKKFTNEKVKPIEEIRLLGVGRRSKETFNVSLVIPTTPPTNQFSKVITLYYQIEVKAKVAKTIHRSAKISIPVIIGTIPINYTINPRDGTNLVATLETFASSSNAVAVVNAQDDGLPPPTYEEVLMMGDQEHNDNEDNDESFSPRYPVYHFEDNKETTKSKDTEQKTKPSQSDFQ